MLKYIPDHFIQRASHETLLQLYDVTIIHAQHRYVTYGYCLQRIFSSCDVCLKYEILAFATTLDSLFSKIFFSSTKK